MRKKPSRANGFENKFIRQFLEARCMAQHDKLLCEVCLGHECGCKDTKSSEGKLINEHIDGDSNNWHPDNLRLASQKCNMREFHRNRKNQAGLELKVSVEKERGRGRGREELLDEIILSKDLKYETISMWKSHVLKKKFFDYIESEMRKHPDGLEVEDLVYDGANVTGLSSKTTREYLKEKYKKTGPYRLVDGYLLWKIRYLDQYYNDEIKKYSK